MTEDFHIGGCPVYDLDSSLQTGTGIGPPKWDPRSRSGVYIGHFPHHAGNVALVLNLQTGHLSLQYHLDFDDEFTTVLYIDSAETSPNWAILVAENSEKATDEAFTNVSMWYEGEVAHTEDQDVTPISNGNKINISTLGLRRSQHIKDPKKAKLETSTPSNETGFLLQTVRTCIKTAM
eukprot:8736312-Ditylum_brightwellii.AAC.1